MPALLAVGGDEAAPAKPRRTVDLTDPEIQRKAKEGRERYWAERRALKAAGQPANHPPRMTGRTQPAGHHRLREAVHHAAGALHTLVLLRGLVEHDVAQEALKRIAALLEAALEAALEADRG